jgi:hypothetical protein
MKAKQLSRKHLKDFLMHEMNHEKVFFLHAGKTSVQHVQKENSSNNSELNSGGGSTTTNDDCYTIVHIPSTVIFLVVDNCTIEAIQKFLGKITS